MMPTTSSWLLWASLSALFAALTAICAKIGVEAINSDFATLLRTIVVVVVLGLLLAASGKLQPLDLIPPRTWVFLVLSGLGTGASWLCYFRALKVGEAARVAPVDKLSVVLVALIGTAFLGERLSLGAWVGIVMITAGAGLVALY